MKKIFVVIFCAIYSISAGAHGYKALSGEPVMPVNEILKNFSSYYSYEYYQVKLSETYTAIDQNNSPISRAKFLRDICTGNYLPVRLKTTDNSYRFQLLVLPTNVKYLEIRNRLIQFGNQYFQYYLMEGKPLPDFNFTDLNRNTYNPTNTKGSTLFIKCWFIHCAACNKEMPELNKLVVEYKKNKSLQFVSLATDKADALKVFLPKIEFLYQTVPDMRNYIEKELGVSAYPTHLVVKEGKILKAFDNAGDLISYIHKHESKIL